MRDDYGLADSGIPPELVAKLLGTRNRQQVAEAMMALGAKPVENMGGPGAKVSWTQGLAQMLNAYQGRKGMEGADSSRQAIADEISKGRQASLDRYKQTAYGAPGVTPLTPNDDEGNAMPSVAAVPGDRRSAITNAFMDPYMKDSPLPKMDLADLNRDEDRAAQAEQRKWELKQKAEDRLREIEKAAAERRITQAQAAEEKAALMKWQAEQTAAIQRMILANRQPPPPIVQTDAAGNVRFFDRDGNLKKEVKGAGKPSATYERNEAARKQLNLDLDGTIKEVEGLVADGGLLDKSTGSGFGAAVDSVAGFAGIATPGAVAAGAIAPIFDKVLKMVPRFEGPQSEKDTQSYKDAAGQLANPKVPNEQKKAAAKEILRLMKARKGQFIPSGLEGDVPASSGSSQPGNQSAPQGVDPSIWNAMTPEEKALWKN